MPRRLVVFAAIFAALLAACKRSPQDQEAVFLKRGDKLLAARQVSRAILEYKNAVHVMPNRAEAHYRLGIAFLDGGDVFNAFRAFHRATELNPKYVPAQVKLSELLNLTQKNDLLQDAGTRLSNVLRDSPNDEEAMDAMAINEFESGKPEDAARRLEESLTKFPARLRSSVSLARLLLAQKNYKGAEEALQEAVAAAPDSSPARLALGQLYIVLQQDEKAEPEIAKAVQLDSKNSAALLTLAQLQIHAKRLDQAEASLKELSALVHNDPANRSLRSGLIRLYLDANRPRDAEKVVSDALQRNPKDLDALLERSRLYLKNGKPRQAEQDLDEVLHLQSSSAAHFELARVYAAEGVANRERQELNEALRLDPHSLAARIALARSFVLAKQPKTALDLINAAPAAQKITVSAVEWRNWALLQAGEYKELRSWLNRTPGAARTPAMVLQDGLLKMCEKDYEGARADAEEVLRLKPDDTRGARLLADAYLARNHVLQATERLTELAAARSSSAPLESLLGEWYMRNGQAAEARQAFETTLTHDPNFISAEVYLADLYRREHRLDAARRCVNAILAKQPGNVPAFLLLAAIGQESGDRVGEIAAYKSAIAVDPSNAFALNNLAYALEPTDLDEALRLAERAVEIAPDNAAAQDTLGGIYYRKQMYGTAVDHLKAAVDREPSPLRQYHLALSYLKSGRTESGQQLLRAALKQDPNLPATEPGW
jgi:tetratricopeptide (TPR) repeat protein